MLSTLTTGIDLKQLPPEASLSIDITQDPATKAVTVARNFGGIVNSNTFKLGEKYSQDNFMGQTVESITDWVDGRLIDRPQDGKFKGKAATMYLQGKDLKFGFLDDQGREIAIIIPRAE